MPQESTRKYSREEIAQAVASSSSILGVLRCLGIRYRSGEAWRRVRGYIEEYGLDASHFQGRGHNRGKVSCNRRTPDEILVVLKGAYREHRRLLRRSLVEIGVPYVCAACGQGPTWQGQTLMLPVDHRNGDWRNCRRENLRFLCPNCHSQTSTFSGRMRGLSSGEEHAMTRR